jgi:P-type Cu2+ transporter
MTPSTRDRHAPGRSVPRAGSTGGHGVHDRHSDHAAVFRDRFWLTLVLAVPVAVFSGMFQDLLGYRAVFPGSSLISPVLGTCELPRSTTRHPIAEQPHF